MEHKVTRPFYLASGLLVGCAFEQDLLLSLPTSPPPYQHDALFFLRFSNRKQSHVCWVMRRRDIDIRGHLFMRVCYSEMAFYVWFLFLKTIFGVCFSILNLHFMGLCDGSAWVG